MGSRGARTFVAPRSTGVAPYSAAPMQRSMTLPATPAPGVSPGYARPGYSGYGYPGRSPFMSGLFGGLLGAGLAGLLFGHGLFWGISGFGSLFGLVLQVVLIVLLARWLLRRFGGPQPIFAGLNGFARGFQPMRFQPPMGRPGGAARGAPLALTPADYQRFEGLLKGIQAAWTAHDLAGLRSMATPEMLSYFAEQLADQTSRGVRNQVSDVRLLKGDLAEAWSEGAHDYATVAMRFTMVDVTIDAAGRVVDGSPTEHVTVAEIWTFLRSGGGAWLLSAIQQAR